MRGGQCDGVARRPYRDMRHRRAVRSAAGASRPDPYEGVNVADRRAVERLVREGAKSLPRNGAWIGVGEVHKRLLLCSPFDHPDVVSQAVGVLKRCAVYDFATDALRRNVPMRKGGR